MKKIISLFISTLMLLMLVPQVLADNAINSSIVTVGDLALSMGICINNDTTILLEEYSLSQDSKCNCETPVRVISFSTPNENGTITTSIIAALEDDPFGEQSVHFSDISIQGVETRSTGSITGSVIDYNSRLGDTYDYYFALGATYSQSTFSSKKAFRPTSTFFYLRAESTATHDIDTATIDLALAGYQVDANGNGDELAIFSFGDEVDCPIDGHQYYYSLVSQWIDEGFSTSDYIWCTTGLHGFLLTLDIVYDNNAYISIEYPIYEL